MTRFSILVLTILVVFSSCIKEEFLFAEKIDFTQGSFSLIVIPDTQYYSVNDSQIAILQDVFDWIKKNKNKYNIKGLLQTGDLTQNNERVEWERIKNAFNIIENEIPYSICLGNHDYEGKGNPDNRETKLNDYFNHKSSIYTSGPEIIDISYMSDNNLENYCLILNTNPKKTLILALEWFPRDKSIKWADSLIQSHQNLDCIVLTHAFLTLENELFDYSINSNSSQKYGPDGSNNIAEQLWDKLIKKHNNIILVLNGHVTGNSFLQLNNEESEKVNLMAFNAQHEPNGGNGWIRLLEFLPDNTKVKVHTLSPSLKNTRIDLDNHFVFSK